MRPKPASPVVDSPATCVEVTSTSGASPLTVTVSLTDEIFSMNGTVAFWPTSSSSVGTLTGAKPDSSACSA